MIDEMTTNLRPTEALLYTPPDGFEIVPMPGPDEPVVGYDMEDE